MKNYMVTFRWYDADVYCVNVCIADDEEKVRKYFSKYSDVNIRPISDDEVTAAKRKGMPITILPVTVLTNV